MKKANWDENMVAELGADFLDSVIGNMFQMDVQFTIEGTASKPDYQLSQYDIDLDYDDSPFEESMVQVLTYNGENHNEIDIEYSASQLSQYFSYLDIISIFDKLPKSRELAERLLEFHYWFKKHQLKGDSSLSKVMEEADEGWEFMLCEIMKGGIKASDAFYNAISHKVEGLVNHIDGKSQFYKLSFTNNYIKYPKYNGGAAVC